MNDTNGELFEMDRTEIYCISLWQPWAQWVMWGWKTIETRLHDRFKNLSGQRIGIHASKKWDEGARAAKKYLSPEQWGATEGVIRTGHRGVLLGTVYVTDTRWLESYDAQRALIECETLRFGLILDRPDPLLKPIEMRGQQGMWRIKLP